ncbi:hypothetical protein AVEN_263145-1 [Araneus ventricosus]|uniref:Uncharacterized protein n=1 Tax=Araneus ventricosus TaxID=182803 RepID=A0A4Y2F8B8_ARAVE|nr:hypothetical protein AVEN_263145-1 [Araneus ventricosus]
MPVPVAISFSEPVEWTWDHSTIQNASPCLLPLQLPNQLDGHGTTLRYRTPLCSVPVAITATNRLDGHGTTPIQNASSCPVPVAITATNRLDGHGTTLTRTSPHAPVLLPVQLPNGWMDMGPTRYRRLPMPRACCHYSCEPVGWTWDHFTIQRHSPPLRACCHYSYRTGWMDMEPLYDRTPHLMPRACCHCFTEPVERTRDAHNTRRISPYPVPVAITAATEPVGWTWDHSTIQNAASYRRACCPYSNRTGWMDMGPL